MDLFNFLLLLKGKLKPELLTEIDWNIIEDRKIEEYSIKNIFEKLKPEDKLKSAIEKMIEI